MGKIIGLINRSLAYMFGIVIVIHLDADTRRWIGFHIGRSKDFKIEAQ